MALLTLRRGNSSGPLASSNPSLNTARRIIPKWRRRGYHVVLIVMLLGFFLAFSFNRKEDLEAAVARAKEQYDSSLVETTTSTGAMGDTSQSVKGLQESATSTSSMGSLTNEKAMINENVVPPSHESPLSVEVKEESTSAATSSAATLANTKTLVFCPSCLYDKVHMGSVTCLERVRFLMTKYNHTEAQAQAAVLSVQPDHCQTTLLLPVASSSQKSPKVLPSSEERAVNRVQERLEAALAKESTSHTVNTNQPLPTDDLDSEADPLGTHPTPLNSLATPLSLQPQTKYLGVLLDAGRHYFSIKWIQRLLDLLYLLNFNLVHFRLTDDQAFAANLTTHPQLAQAAFGYTETYTAQELRELVEYAAQRKITLMPEMNIPGHAGGWAGIPGLVVQCPKFACRTAYGIPLNVSHPQLPTILKDVLWEVKDIFHTSPYFHLGGDEVEMSKPCFDELGVQMFDYAQFEQDLKQILEEVDISQERVLRWEMSGQKVDRRAGNMTHYWLSWPGEPSRYRSPKNRNMTVGGEYFISAGLYFDTSKLANAWDIYGRARRSVTQPPSTPLPTAIVAGTFELGPTEWFEANVVGRLLGVAMAASGNVYSNSDYFSQAFDAHCKALGLDPRLCALRGRPTAPQKYSTMNWRPVMRGKWEKIMCERVMRATKEGGVPGNPNNAPAGGAVNLAQKQLLEPALVAKEKIPKYNKASIRSVACQTQDIPDETTYVREMTAVTSLEQKLKEPGRCIQESCRMMCGSESFQLPRLPTGMLLSVHQASAIWCALYLEKKRLGRPANLLVWGLGNDSPFWKSSTTGRVVFIEDNAEWFQRIQKEHALEQYLTQYTSKINRDMSRVGTKEFASEMDVLLNQLHLANETWDVILVDAPSGCSNGDVGRFGPIYSSRKQVDQQGHGHVFVDDFQRRPEAVTSDAVLVDSDCNGEEYCPVKVAVWDRIHPASKRYIEKTALFSFGKSATPEAIQILRGLEGAIG